jgi:hypothetical protein
LILRRRRMVIQLSQEELLRDIEQLVDGKEITGTKNQH